MCGRFALSAKTKSIEHLLPDVKIPDELPMRYNIAPTQNITAVLNDGKKELSSVRWGLIPFWAKDASIGTRMINARAETLNEKPTFKNLIKRKRCLILADGFYEWKKMGGKQKSIPYFINLKSGLPFVFAGLWDNWQNENNELLTTATIITTSPNELMSTIHERMPVILRPDCMKQWLSTNFLEKASFDDCLKPYPSEEMEAYQISSRVNNPRYDDPLCIERV